MGCTSAQSHPVSHALTLERIFSEPSLDGPAPRSIQISPDGKRVTYLKEKETDLKTLDLWEYNVETRTNQRLVDSSTFLKGPENLTADEKARRERMRVSQSGIVEYAWSESGNSLLFPISGGIFVAHLNGDKAEITKIPSGTEHETDPHLSPEGRYVSYVKGSNLYVYDLALKKSTQLTQDGSESVKYGIPEFIAQEEMDRFDAQWWSEDDRFLAFTRIDESPVGIADRYEIGGDSFTVFHQRYPAAGTPNVKVKLGVVDLKSPRPRIQWLDLGPNDDHYLARAKWLSPTKIAAEIETRSQKELSLFVYSLDQVPGKRLVLTEKNTRWIDLNNDLHFLPKRNQMIWGSARSGYKHLLLCDPDGKVIRDLTPGNFPVEAMLSVDDSEENAYFSSSGANPLEMQLFRVKIQTGEVTQITKEKGWHQISSAKNASVYVDTFSTPMSPPQVSLHSMNGVQISFIEENKLSPAHPLFPFIKNFSEPEFGSFKTANGIELYYELIKPSGSSKAWPLIVDVYGGPGRQKVNLAWGRKNFLWHQILAQEGFAVLSLDNRGTPNRGTEFEQAIYHELGKVEVEDQKAGVELMISKGVADPSRIGVFGWSYGGFMSLSMILREPELFHSAVSVAPVTDWALYDTFYTEKFMGTPSENPGGYQRSNVATYVDRLRGKLMMIHGMADDNVLFTHSTKIYKALQDRSIPFEMMAYPGSKHGISGKAQQIHVYRTATEFFERTLQRD